MNKRTFLALLAGVVFIIVATTLIDIVLHIAKIYPPMDQAMDDKLALLASSYRLIIGVLGALLTAKIGRDAPMKHAMMLGYVGTVLGLIGLLTTWDKGLAPIWFPISLVIIAIPQCWLGGKLYTLWATKSAVK